MYSRTHCKYSLAGNGCGEAAERLASKRQVGQSPAFAAMGVKKPRRTAKMLTRDRMDALFGKM